MRFCLAIPVSCFFLFYACNSEPSESVNKNKLVVDSTLVKLLKRSDSVGITRTDEKEVSKSIRKIEKKYGEQWDFCECVKKGDSINKALQVRDLSESMLNKLLRRFDEIDQKCQAFKIIDPSRTPEDRALHEKKVRDCLNEF